MAKGAKQSSRVAPEQFLGYSLQVTRALVRLLRAQPGEFVAVEHVDDVSQHRADGSVVAEQLKVTRKNPLSDRSEALWKTLANWRELLTAVPAAQRGNYSFELVVVAGFKPGATVRALVEAGTPHDAAAAIKSAREAILQAKKGVSTSLRAHVERAVADPLDVIVDVVTRFSAVSGLSVSPQELARLLLSKAVPDEIVEETTKPMLGWVKLQIDTAISRGDSPVIAVDAFLRELTTWVRKLDSALILSSFAPTPTDEATRAELTVRTYVRQLQIVDCDETFLLAAADAYLRATHDRTTWASKGLVNPSSYDDFEADLTDAWQAKKRACDITEAHRLEPDRGRLLLLRCLDECTPSLQGRQVRPYFVSGCLHSLADVQLIGWHPRYKDLL